jgi:hypothetical protein
MANSDTPFGLRPIGNLNGGPYTGNLVKVAFEDENAVATFIGDLVRLEGSADTDGNPTVDQFAAADTDAFGVIVAFEPDRTNLERKHRLASTARTAYVVPCNAGQLFVIQADEDIVAGDVGNTADVTVGSGNTTSGISAMELDSSNIGTGLNLQIVAVYPSPDNAMDENFTKVIVRVNENSISGVGAGS